MCTGILAMTTSNWPNYWIPSTKPQNLLCQQCFSVILTRVKTLTWLRGWRKKISPLIQKSEFLKIKDANMQRYSHNLKTKSSKEDSILTIFCSRSSQVTVIPKAIILIFLWPQTALISHLKTIRVSKRFQTLTRYMCSRMKLAQELFQRSTNQSTNLLIVKSQWKSYQSHLCDSRQCMSNWCDKS